MAPLPGSGAGRRKDLWTRLWSSPDPDLVDAGQRGEWMVATIRLLIVVLLLYFPLSSYVSSPLEGRSRIVLWVAVAALAEALIVYSAVRRSWGRSWIGFFSGFVDVSLVSLALWVHVPLGDPHLAISDLVIFPLYLLAIGATSLRYDWRICALSGFGAITEYGLIAFSVLRSEDASDADRLVQGGRLTLLLLATALATSLVLRSRELRHLSTRDRLTGIANRGFFEESLPNIEALASRSGDAVTVAMLDVDRFKSFNDTWGHLAGDECLRRLAGVLDGAFRSGDLLARYGGEEFSGVFPGLGPDNAQRRMEALRREIAETRIPLPNRDEEVRVTVSIGVAIWPFDGEDLGKVLGVADQRLYAAKARGRDRVVGPAAPD